MSEIIGVLPYLANLPSCVFYLRPFGDPNGGTTFKDWGPDKSTITRSGATNSTAYKKFPPGSMYIAGNSGYYLSIPHSAKMELAGNNFAFAFWFCPTSMQGTYSVLMRVNAILSNQSLQVNPGSAQGGVQVIYRTGSTSKSFTGTYTFTTGTWYHVAIIRVGSVLYAYVNGSSTATYAIGTDTLYNYSGYFEVGGLNDHTAYCQNAYVDEVALWNGAYGPVPTIDKLYPQIRRLIG